MTWIRTTPVEGEYTDVVKAISINTRAMDAVYEMTQAISFGSSALTRIQEESIATAVSAVNHCRY
ncbi:MAG: hypothetical protein O3C10_11715 [Chloroflexi bacterium]|nr:hypothetical protein [Chloroflexota bacterium]